MRNRNLIIYLIVLGVCASAYAQTPRALIEEDVTRIGNQLHHYEPPQAHDTKAPRGYKPFYVSHYGRHGSRYHESDKTYTGTIKALRTIDSLGLLTDTGREMLRDLDTLASYHVGMGGFLTQRGSKEQQGVAERLYDRCPQIFRQKDRSDALAVSSTVVRCNQSMMNFCTSLKGKSPQLEITYVTNRRTDQSLTRVSGGKPVSDRTDNGLAVIDSIKHARMDVSRIAPMMFKDISQASRYIKDGDLCQFFFQVINLGVIEQCLDEDAPELYKYFTADELFNYWVTSNAAVLNAHGFSYENREVLRRCGKLELADILEKADEAMDKGSHKCADLRFGHDGGVLPLVFFLGLERNDEVWHLGTEWEHGWYGFENIPMCTNVQMIFYRNKKGDVIVKFLHNERETSITKLKAWKGPYYKWTELRPYLEKLAKTDC